MLAQFFLAQEVSGKDEPLRQRAQSTDREIDQLCSRSKRLREGLGRKQDIGPHRHRLCRTGTKRLEDAASRARSTSTLRATASAAALAFDQQKQISAQALAQVDVLNQQITALRKQQRPSRTRSPRRVDEQGSQSKRSPISVSSNVALARKFQELNRYRSDFSAACSRSSAPGRCPGGRRQVSCSNPRCCSTSARPTSAPPNASLDTLAAAVIDLEREIPPASLGSLEDDGGRRTGRPGHTDSPITGTWSLQVELGLSAARAVGRAISDQQGRRARPFGRGRTGRRPVEPRDRRRGARPQPTSNSS